MSMDYKGSKYYSLMRILLHENEKLCFFMSFRSLNRIFGFTEDTSVRKTTNKFNLRLNFVTTQQRKCKHIFALAVPKFGFSLT